MTFVQIDRRDRVATISFGDERSLGRLHSRLRLELAAAVTEAAADAQVRAIVLRGSARAFSVGQDLAEFQAATGDDFVRSTIEREYAPIVEAIVTAPKPVIAMLTGVTAGAGLSIALACDLRVASASASMTTAFAGIGLAADTGATWTLPRMVGRAVALDLLLRPRAIGAEEALGLGLVTAVFDDDVADAELDAFVDVLANGPTQAYAAIKRSIDESAGLELGPAMLAEAEHMVRTSQTDDHREAVAAFLAKRPPRFLGH